MRSLYCMTAALMLAAGVSARADVVGMVNVSGIFTNSIKVSDMVVADTMNRAGEFVSAFYSPMDVVEQENAGLFSGDVCSIATACDGSVGMDEGDTSSTLPLQTVSGATRSAEPSSVALLGTGLLGFAAVMRRRFLG